jgi:hypothetical protein
MTEEQLDLNRALMLDGNAVAGLLRELFAVEMTTAPCQCAHCGRVGPLGSLWTFAQAPGVVLRCPGCEEVVLRMVKTGVAIYLDARGAAYLRLETGAG